MPPAATCCLLQTTRQHYRRLLIRHGSPRFPTPFCSMRTVTFSIKILAVWISLSCGEQFLPASLRITSASINTGKLVPARNSRRRVAADEITRKPRKPRKPDFLLPISILATNDWPNSGVTKRIPTHAYTTCRDDRSNFGELVDAGETGSEEWHAKSLILDRPWKRRWHWTDPCRPSRASRPLYHFPPVPHRRSPRKMERHTASWIAPSI